MKPFRHGFASVVRTPGYLLGFLLLNLGLALLGTLPFRAGASQVLGHSGAAQGLLKGFDLGLLVELLNRPEMGQGLLGSSLASALVFALAGMVLLPGVLMAYAAGGRLGREAFFGACGRNVWRFARLLGLFLVGAALLGGTLGWIAQALQKAVEDSTRERLPFGVGVASALAVLAVMTLLRMWFDLAQAHVVLRDQKAVRRSLSAAFRLLLARGGRLFLTYLAVTLLAAVAVAAGLLFWRRVLPADSVLGAFLTGQAILVALLFARFWQRAAAVAVVASA